MLGGRGFFRGSSILLTGTSGTGKSIISCNFAQAAGRRGERVLYFSFEESPNQIIRNMHSIGLRLQPLVKRGLLRIHSARPSLYGLEMHLATMFKEIATFKPKVVIIDPITSLMDLGTASEGKGMVTRLIDYLKAGEVTSLFTSLTQGGAAPQQTESTMASLMDAWLLLQDFEGNGERNRVLYVLKARGMAHSNQIREFLISNHGIDVVDAYIGPSGVLTGSARVAQSSLEKAALLAGQQESARRKREIERKRTAIERQISGLRSDYETEAVELKRIDEQVGTSTQMLTTEARPPRASSARRMPTRRAPRASRGPGGTTGENQARETRPFRPPPPHPALAAAPLCDGRDAQVSDGLRQPEAAVRNPSQGPLPHQGDRPGQAPAAGQGRPDPRHPHGRAPSAPARAHHHRHAFQHRPCARRPRPAHGGLTGTTPLKTKPPRPRQPPGKYVLRLYVAGATVRSRQAVLRVRELCATELQDRCDLEVIDIFQQPRLARQHQIVATPTLVIEFPRPMRRFIGNLVNTADLVFKLDLHARGRVKL